MEKHRYLDERIRILSMYLRYIRTLQDEILPEGLPEKVKEIELLLRGYIHELEENLHE